MITTLEDIVEELADKLGVYGSHAEDESTPCRCCWTADLKARIRDAVAVEEALGMGGIR